MIEIAVPGHKQIKVNHLVLDYNGTLACDGKLLDGVRQNLNLLAKQIQIHLLTADTFGNVKSELSGITCELSIISSNNQEISKLKYIEALGTKQTVCIGNGRNDRLMLKEAALGIAVVQKEGMSTEAMVAADIISPDINVALELLTHPLRLIATLRS